MTTYVYFAGDVCKDVIGMSTARVLPSCGFPAILRVLHTCSIYQDLLLVTILIERTYKGVGVSTCLVL